MRQADPRMPGSPRTRWSKRLLYSMLPFAAFLLAACGGDKPQSALDPQGPIARQLDNLFTPVFLIATVVFVFVEGLIIYVIVKFRAKGDDDSPKQIHGNTRLELTWTVIPALILAVIGVFTVGSIFDLSRRAEGAEVVQVEVIGHQWWWEFNYPD
ncbi:MAG: cytochrome c oxidase subunit II transmembrane domain-containing protein, partial [Acidimicrobiales bacterium]